MANTVYAISKGKVAELLQRVENNIPAGCKIQIKLFKAFTFDAGDNTETEVVASGSTECDFTNYETKSIVAAALTPPADDGTNMIATLPDQTWAAAGGTLDNDILKLVTFYDPDGSDTAGTNVPMTAHDFVKSTNGGDIVSDGLDAATGFFSAA